MPAYSGHFDSLCIGKGAAMTRVALYARVSTKEQDDHGTSLDSQLKRMREAADHTALTVVAERDEDFTGMTHDRPKMNEIVEMARRGEIDAILCYSRDRYCRSRIAGLMLDMAFREAGVDRLYVTREKSQDTPQGKLRDGFDDLLHEYEVENLKERTARGRREKAEQGILTGQGRVVIYGYRKVKNGREISILKADTATYTVAGLKSEVAIVRWIFEKFVYAGWGPTKIADTLNLYDIPSPSETRGIEVIHSASNKWTNWVIYPILRREEYTGVFYALRYKKEGKKVTLRPKDEWIRIERPDLAIIPEKMFRTAQAMLDEGRKLHPGTLKYEYLFSKRVKCSQGHRMVCRGGRKGGQKSTNSYMYFAYLCLSDRRYKGRCEVPQFQSRKVDAAVWSWVKDLIRNPEVVLRGYQKAQQKTKDGNAEIYQWLAACAAMHEKEEAELQYLMEEAKQFRANVRVREQYRQQIADCSKRIELLEQQRADYERQVNNATLTDLEIQNRVTFIQKLNIELDKLGELPFGERRKLIELLNIEITLGVENGDKYIDITWYGEGHRLWLGHQDFRTA
jgi:site-specific DNA recombinase